MDLGDECDDEQEQDETDKNVSPIMRDVKAECVEGSDDFNDDKDDECGQEIFPRA